MSSKAKITSKSKAPNSKKKDGHVDEMQEARTTQRVPIQLLVDYRCDGHYLFDFCKDLGTGGVFIETNNSLEHGSKVDLTFTLPDSKETLQTSGRVIWVQTAIPEKKMSAGMGVQFEAFNSNQRELLDEFIKRHHSEGLNKKKTGKTA